MFTETTVEGHLTFRHRQTGKIADSEWIARFEMETGRIAGGNFTKIQRAWPQHARSNGRPSWPVEIRHQ